MNHTTCVFEEAANTSIRIATVDVEWVLLIGIFGILITKVCIWPIGVAAPILDCVRMEGIDCIKSGVWPHKVPAPQQRLELRRCSKERSARIAGSSTVRIGHEMHAIESTTSGPVHSGGRRASDKLGSVSIDLNARRA